eukprot:CAMPEP_0181180292 /NCGR_PEP_ID=MMETSP1096-20121128/6719_1 /TAXON_ID=156174 ORGANISM="Chrysochromulina ericina, Strain CCMP281" /NCGR_SAMPLE_ID=MMETSP1096 /ASSEMBLY_ACC=CAM_ASM_000453 /LENGTH=246 /DNA_ID=CAMNT_0023268705 /DNA_START=283 /DNA_END=1024 /DNA_ORIENTATION=-
MCRELESTALPSGLCQRSQVQRRGCDCLAEDPSHSQSIAASSYCTAAITQQAVDEPGDEPRTRVDDHPQRVHAKAGRERRASWVHHVIRKDWGRGTPLGSAAVRAGRRRCRQLKLRVTAGTVPKPNPTRVQQCLCRRPHAPRRKLQQRAHALAPFCQPVHVWPPSEREGDTLADVCAGDTCSESVFHWQCAPRVLGEDHTDQLVVDPDHVRCRVDARHLLLRSTQEHLPVAEEKVGIAARARPRVT